MISGSDLVKINRAEEKLERGEALTAEEQAVIEAHPEWLKKNLEKVCGHNGCTNKLGPRVDGERQKIAGKEVCDDCYFDAFGKELDSHPILPPRIRRRA